MALLNLPVHNPRVIEIVQKPGDEPDACGALYLQTHDHAGRARPARAARARLRHGALLVRRAQPRRGDGEGHGRRRAR